MNGTLNKVMLIGHLGDEVKLHYFEGGNCIGRFPLATHEVFTNKEGEKISSTEWHNIVVRNKLAETCEKHLTKGDRIYCEGKLKTRQWTTENGQTRYATEIHISELTFLSNKKAENNSSSYKSVQDTIPEPPQVNIDNPKDDLPF